MTRETISAVEICIRTRKMLELEPTKRTGRRCANTPSPAAERFVPMRSQFTKTCSVDGCERPHQARGLCLMHYKRWRKTDDYFVLPTASLSDRFWSKAIVSGSDDCWEWTATKRAGYGRIRVGGHLVNANRVAWELTYGEIPEGMLVCHHCDNPSCVNPNHLFLGTNGDNIRDMFQKGRGNPGQAHGEINGQAKLTETQVIEIIQSDEIHKVLAARFGVSRSTVSMIKNGTNWRRVDG